MRNKWARRLIVILFLGIHAVMLARSAALHSPTWDEVGHMAAGISHWQYRHFRLYRVNPPLVRLVATAPVIASGGRLNVEIDLSRIERGRPEFGVGEEFLKHNFGDWERHFFVARLMCISFSLVGGLVVYCWANELYGHTAGIMGLCLWSFSPNVLAHAQLITPDCAAAALGAAACFAFWRWLRRQEWRSAVFAGLVLGLALLSKTTWIILPPLLPILWLIYCRPPTWRSAKPSIMQLATLLTLGICVLNLGYFFEGTFNRLGDFRFYSQALSGLDGSESARSGNRFRDSWLAGIPVPLPANYVLGIDDQKCDFEKPSWSYLRGQWRQGGWWYYYIYALLVKVPLGTWFLVALTVSVSLGSVFRQPFPSTWRDELVLWTPVIVILALASSQTAFNRHLRYVLPVFPFVFIWLGKLMLVATREKPIIRGLSFAATATMMIGSLWCYPHSLSYFNAMVGGPRNGHLHLGSSNVDWGQDLFLLRSWLERHPQAKPLMLAFDGGYDPAVVGIDFVEPPLAPSDGISHGDDSIQQYGPIPGWYAVSVNLIHSHSGRLDYLQEFQPVAQIGYSMNVYHVAENDANRVREQLDLPLLEVKPESAGGDK